MSETQKNTKKYGKATLVLAIILSAAAAIGAWEAFRLPSQAVAATRHVKPDPLNAGVQRQAQLAEQKKTNTRLDEMLRLLKSGKLKFIAVEDKTARKSRTR